MSDKDSEKYIVGEGPSSRSKVAPINPHIAIGWTQAHATGVELIENVGLKDKIMDAFMGRIHLDPVRLNRAIDALKDSLDELGIN